jgi:centromeric protein E
MTFGFGGPSRGPKSATANSPFRGKAVQGPTLKKKRQPGPHALPVEEPKDTRIEVCARVRPLVISVDREGFFDGGGATKASSSSSRRSLLGSRSKQPSQRTPNSPTSNEALLSKDSDVADDFVAWDVNTDGDTAGQSNKTQLIQGRTHSYTLDKVYSPSASTSDIYHKQVHSMVKAAMEGYHSTVLAYGQTSTGKTFTMTGTKQEPGLIPLCIQDCFRYLKDLSESREYLIRLSYLEVYKENIRDLLANTPQPVRLFDGPDGLVVKGLKEEVVTTPEQVFAILREGESRRQVGATHMNQHSSRSHVMVRLWIESSDVQITKKTGLLGRRTVKKEKQSRVSSLSLVDLAGSESVRLNGDDRREEGHYINKSLMTLGQVVLSLSEDRKGHIPYRDSKLTRLLQPSLSGNARVVLLCCISPLASHMEESHNTFKFATRAKKIKQKAVVNVMDDEKTLLQNYRDEIEDLRKQLREAKEQQKRLQEATPAPENTSQSDEEVKELVEAIRTMERLILKSKPANHPTPTATSSETEKTNTSTTLDDSDLDMLLADDDELDLVSREDDEDLREDPESTPVTPAKEVGRSSDEDDLTTELNRIRGLLGSVLQKRMVPSTPGGGTFAKTLDYAQTPTTPRTPENDEEVESLRKQLEQQELATSLRKADSSFLQRQLQEKDELLEEVSKVLEAVEKRQNELEAENFSLKEEVAALRARLQNTAEF